MITINLSERQKKIIEIVKKNEPIPSKEIAKKLDLTRGALRSDLSVLTMANILNAKPKVGYFHAQDNSYLKEFDELYNKKVKEIKSAPVVIKEEENSIYDAIVTLFLEDVGSVFIIDSNEALVGVVSRKDLLKMTIGETNINQIPVSVAMTRMSHIITITDDDTVFEAAKKIIDYEIDVIPVVKKIKKDSKERLKVIGKVSKTNITRVFVDFRLDI
ncbi:putative signal-transduction protein containing cAMP-binding and CBS domains [Halobacteroides halobius DSM 5150]|uniref:Putative signal-transduction protein containing cAMP-binding and CBS domains n=1 Tax=Halobacteroides halobius (strain ATCC 35273 / DSM 5150 / MD-1) TaxID=748449 RepID=L0KBQ6_HALHC|nr:helix-turn-helix transcriptional regulator [Halobacteroides halobius]AGB41784.1 putative signal-transduction protein containing cAMP-binding and CBS domains [Halobacteroides halobius DSM 5150]